MDGVQAIELVSSVMRLAATRSENVCVAIVEPSGHLLAFARSPHSVVPAIDVTVGKAYTAATLGVETGALGELTAPGGPLDGLLTAAQLPRPLVTLRGGVPVSGVNGLVCGLGVGGSSAPDIDHELASEAIALM